jgi:hypothetical protein
MLCGHSAHGGVVADDIGGASNVVFNIRGGNGRQPEFDEFLWFFLFDHYDTVGV